MSETLTTPVACEAPFGESPAPRVQAQGVDLYRLIWRWHLYAGLIVGPLLIMASLTGGLLVFRPQIERATSLPRVVVGSTRASYEVQLATVQGLYPDWQPTAVNIAATSDRATSIRIRQAATKKSLNVFVDPYTARFRGADESQASPFFKWLVGLHRDLFIGRTGRFVLELAASWSLVLLATGVVLAWPRRGWAQMLRTWRTQWQRSRLRSLHIAAGAAALPAAVVILGTSLWFTPVWGDAFKRIAAAFGQRAFVVPPASAIPKSTHRPAGSPLALQAAVANLQQLYPDGSYFIGFPRKPDDGFFVTVQGDYGSSTWAVLVLDAADGRVLTHRRTGELGWMDWWVRWNMPLHAGTVGGLATQTLWLATSLALATLPLTGAWMWWRRRPRAGRAASAWSGAPRWLFVPVVLGGILLPTVGLSLILVTLLDWGVTRSRKYPSASAPQLS